MNSRSGFEYNEQHELTENSLAVRRAGAGAEAWRTARDAHQQVARPDHLALYGLTAELFATLGPMASLMRLMSEQTAAYADSVPDGRRVYDDSSDDDPRELLEHAAQVLSRISSTVSQTALELNQFWSLIGRIGVEDVPGTRPGVTS